MVEGGGESQVTGTHTATADVFISYASQDAAVASAVVADLERHGIKCWIAPRDVTPGALYADEIIRSINGAKALVIVLSASAVASPHVGKEVERACSKRRAIITFRTDAAPLTTALEYFLSESQWVDVGADGTKEAFAKLVTAVQRQLACAPAGEPGIPGGAAQPAGEPARRSSASARRNHRLRLSLAWMSAAICLIGAYLIVTKLWLSTHVIRGKPAAAAASTATATAPQIPDKSVAVLPFLDMSEKHDQEYFSDGLSEELIDMLTKVPDLRVPARTSSFYFKGKQATIADIARALGVSHVLEGSVRKSGNTLRVTAQLIRIDNGYHVWSETYDRKLDDIFKVQDEIAGEVVKALKVSLLGAATPHATPTASTEAYNIFLQARYFAGRDNTEDLDKAVALYQRAIALDPNYAPAYAWLAWCHERRVGSGNDTSDVGYPKARAAAERAIALDPRLPEGYVTLGWERVAYEFDWLAGAELIGQAQALDANNPLTLLLAGIHALATRTPAEASTYLRRAVEQDPLNLLPRRYLAKALYYGDRNLEAQTTLRGIIDINPQFPAAHYWLSLVLIALGDSKAALSAIEAEPSPVWKPFGLPLAYWALDRKAEAHTALAALVANSAGAEFQVAEAYGYLDKRDEALHWLEQARVHHDPGLMHVRGDPLLRTLVKDPRYLSFLRRIKLPE